MKYILIKPNIGWCVMYKSKIKALVYLYKLLKNDNVKEIKITKSIRYIKR